MFWTLRRKRILIALWIVIPAAAETVVAAWEGRNDARYDALSETYECDPPENCSIDLTGDGTLERFVVESPNAPWRVRIVGERGDLYTLPYDHTDGTLRTHFAVVNDGRPRLLVYDGASQSPPVSLALGWDGATLQETAPTAFESDVLAAMASRDDTGGWHERTLFRLFRRIVRLAIIYGTGLIVWGLVIHWRRHPDAV